MTTADQPWISPECGHFVVRADPTTCATCIAPVTLIEYTGPDQATTIRNQTHTAKATRSAAARSYVSRILKK